jgi:hypothetical protein
LQHDRQTLHVRAHPTDQPEGKKMSKCVVYCPNEMGEMVEVKRVAKATVKREVFGVWHDNSQSWEAGPMSLIDAAEHAARCGDEVMFYGNGSPQNLNRSEMRVVRDMLREGSE